MPPHTTAFRHNSWRSDHPALHCYAPTCSQAAKVLVGELPREAFGVRPACWRCRKVGVLRKREQAPRTPNASRSSVTALARCIAFAPSSTLSPSRHLALGCPRLSHRRGVRAARLKRPLAASEYLLIGRASCR